ncbi:FecR family protein [Parapedobacter sp. GCM10030251]|uniref:FecR family protein n=1 Tax=Parapedobacter sp. GCM10030251 TaxID=3273419 RepID=UPI00361E0A7B
MDKQTLHNLLDRYAKNACTEEERALVETWYNKTTSQSQSSLAQEDMEADLQEIRQRLSKGPVRRPVSWVRYAAAVAILLISGGMYWFVIRPMQDDATRQPYIAATTADDILPGGNKALLTLANGQTIELSSDKNGVVIGDDEIAYADGSLILDSNSGDQLLSLTTPKGGEYQIILPDGTKVWMNAASSLRYPARFDDDMRLVELTGEAYFEVTKDQRRPFKVVSRNQTIEVLGTHFNINSYADEPTIKTTLLEGAVRVIEQGSQMEVVLAPGQQASLDRTNHLRVSTVDVTNAIAWKNGLFRFDNTDIETIMRQLSRWYGVEVLFEGNKPDLKLWGNVYRNLNASQVLEILTYFKLKYRIETESGVKRIVIYT